MSGRVVVMIALAVSPVCAVAQKTEDEIKARMVGKALYLRGEWSQDKLEFDSSGHLSQSVTPIAFTLAGVDIQTVTLSGKGLELDGQRVGLAFDKDAMTRVVLPQRRAFSKAVPEKMTIRIAVPADGDYTAALDEIFTDSFAGFYSPLPDCWQWYARSHHLIPAVAVTATGSVLKPGNLVVSTGKLRMVGGSVTAPQLTYQVDPQYTQAAGNMHYEGMSLVRVILGANGIPSNLIIVRPLGLGLDEAAVAAVAEYRFRPATEDGKPVAVELNVEVNFRIF
jgi:TonB family protein